jgi:predicted nucleic acid-binding protein
MTYLLDTNVVAETSKPLPDSKCVAWLLAHRGKCALSAVTVAEIRYGIERLPDGKRKAAVEAVYQFLMDD